MPRSERDIVIGEIIGPIGIRGEVKALVKTDFPERFDAGHSVVLQLSDDERRPVKIERCRPHKGGIVLKLEGIDTRDDAEKMRRVSIVVDESELMELPDDEFYVFDLIGLKVVTDDGREQGEIVEILQGGANDVYVTSTGLCIPALKDVVASIDLDEGVMVIRPVPGLIAEE